MPDVSGSQALATKAAGRRSRVAVFGGSRNKKTGRRGRAGAQFNRGEGTPFQQAQQRIRDFVPPQSGLQTIRSEAKTVSFGGPAPLSALQSLVKQASDGV